MEKSQVESFSLVRNDLMNRNARRNVYCVRSSHSAGFWKKW